MIQQHTTPKPPIQSCHQSKHGCPNPPKGLGDYVEILAKPIARALNKLGPHIERLGRWCTTVGQPGSNCGCQTRKARLNNFSATLKRLFTGSAKTTQKARKH